jgi:YhcH/YjgK/YiaL family protein
LPDIKNCCMKKTKIFLLIFLLGNKIFSQATEGKVETAFETLIFPTQSQHTHGSSLVSLPNGDILSAWFQGSGERTADDVKIMGARLKKGSKTWSEPFVMADTYGLPDCNPVLFMNNHNKLFLVWIAVQAHKWEASILRFRTSVNYNSPGAPVWNWQDNILLAPTDSFAIETALKFKQLAPAHSGDGGYAPKYDNMIIEASRDLSKRSTGWMTRIKALRLSNGRILLPLYSDGYSLSMVAISDDDGETWHPSLPIVGRGNVQPALAQKKNGNVVAYMRDNGDAPPRVQVSESTDSGHSWSAAQKTEIPNTASVELISMKDGRWAFVVDDEEDGRYRLCLYISDDEGKTWKWKNTFENNPDKRARYSYPSLIQTTDGLLHISYSYQNENSGESIKYVVVDPKQFTEANTEIAQWIKKKEWANGLALDLHSSVNTDSFYVAYHRNKKLWDAAFNFLKTQNLETIAPGKYPILGDEVFATVTEAPSHKKDSVKWESHKNYIDLQYIIKGQETIGVADTSKATIIKPYSPDVINYQAEGNYYTAGQGQFFLFFPNNAHRPTILIDVYPIVKKIVIKIQTAKAE